MERFRHHAGDRIDAAVERERLPDDGGVVPEALPQRAGNHGAAEVSEPVTDDRLDAETFRQGHGHQDTVDVVRLPGERQVLARLPEPSEGVKGPGPLLEYPCIVGPEAWRAGR